MNKFYAYEIYILELIKHFYISVIFQDINSKYY